MNYNEFKNKILDLDFEFVTNTESYGEIYYKDKDDICYVIYWDKIKIYGVIIYDLNHFSKLPYSFDVEYVKIIENKGIKKWKIK